MCSCLQVCLDLYLMRQVAASISALPEVTTDWPALIDTWAVRFLHEMDYTREAANGQLFRCAASDSSTLQQLPRDPAGCWKGCIRMDGCGACGGVVSRMNAHVYMP